MSSFRLTTDLTATGDQPRAIEQLTDGIRDGLDRQILLGVTGSGKTFTMANIIERVQRPALVIAHNKTLAAQLCSEFRDFFGENARAFGLVGTVDDAKARLQPYLDIGVRDFIFDLRPPGVALETAEILAESIVPYLNAQD